MYRDLIPALADRYRLIASDYLGYGWSDAPSTDQFTYTFESMTTVVTHFLAALGLQRYSLYLQDFGAPIGFRIAARHPEQVSAIISQNGNRPRTWTGRAPAWHPPRRSRPDPRAIRDRGDERRTGLENGQQTHVQSGAPPMAAGWAAVRTPGQPSEAAPTGEHEALQYAQGWLRADRLPQNRVSQLIAEQKLSPQEAVKRWVDQQPDRRGSASDRLIRYSQVVFRSGPHARAPRTTARARPRRHARAVCRTR
ncbi:MAG: alpha/beta fold hydrolase [Actinoallomurus sp.]